MDPFICPRVLLNDKNTIRGAMSHRLIRVKLGSQRADERQHEHCPKVLISEEAS